ncbi:MAG TPA: hypothetical protein DCQ58_10485, partial [Saprospirales bacterium]|nr:hypothetical protein [Saprospirales bacterium]
RFKIETTTTDERFNFLSEHPQTKLYFASISQEPKVKIHYRKDNKTMEMEVGLAEFIDVKGWKAFGNKLGEFKLTKVIDLTPEIVSSDVQEIKGETDDTIYDEAIDLIDENVEQNFEQPEEINGSDEQADAGTEETV